MNRLFVSLGAWLAMAGVALGAFGAHALRDRISAASLEIWKTGVQYHTMHALALILVGMIAAHHVPAKSIRIAGWLFVAGIAIFGGSLYALAITDIKVLGAITPLGGLCFLSGWATLALAVQRGQKS